MTLVKYWSVKNRERMPFVLMFVEEESKGVKVNSEFPHIHTTMSIHPETVDWFCELIKEDPYRRSS